MWLTWPRRWSTVLERQRKRCWQVTRVTILSPPHAILLMRGINHHAMHVSQQRTCVWSYTRLQIHKAQKYYQYSSTTISITIVNKWFKISQIVNSLPVHIRSYRCLNNSLITRNSSISITLFSRPCQTGKSQPTVFGKIRTALFVRNTSTGLSHHNTALCIMVPWLAGILIVTLEAALDAQVCCLYGFYQLLWQWAWLLGHMASLNLQPLSLVSSLILLSFPAWVFLLLIPLLFWKVSFRPSLE